MVKVKEKETETVYNRIGYLLKIQYRSLIQALVDFGEENSNWKFTLFLCRFKNTFLEQKFKP